MTSPLRALSTPTNNALAQRLGRYFGKGRPHSELVLYSSMLQVSSTAGEMAGGTMAFAGGFLVRLPASANCTDVFCLSLRKRHAILGRDQEQTAHDALSDVCQWPALANQRP